ncbi:MAG: DUF1559 domain-containing protein [Planctomycetales bacterium]|nr:DUF1559 domain-containing protein [Planctomycetales bacterium]
MPASRPSDSKYVLNVLYKSLLIGLAVTVSGCGESQQDLFMKHAQRDRGDATKDAAAAPKPDPAPQDAAPQNVPKAPSPQIARTDATPQESAAPTIEVPDHTVADPASLTEELGIKPIDQRKPEVELTVAQRRRRSFENLQKINDAIMMYVSVKGHYPARYRTASAGIPSLSWRVEILPYLGYKELYNKFDFSRAWNMQPNKDLLQFIPDEFVSPERFDVKTNYLVPASPGFMFGDNRPLAMSQIDDGPENTIMLVEVNDEHAVNWTEPKDFEPEQSNRMSPYLGKLRVDGTFALWASGFPVLLESGLRDQQLFQAMTYKMSDELSARDIHRAITVEEAEADPEIDGPMPEQVADVAEAGTPLPPGMEMTLEPIEEVIVREPIPSAIELTSAQDKLRQIFHDKLVEAKTAEDKSRLASEFIATAEGLDADPAGAYVLQRAALRLAIESSDSTVLIKAVDQRVARFEVDSFRENLKWIQEFGEQTASRDSSTVKGDEILRRAIPVIYAGIRENEFMLASSVSRIANRFTGRASEDKVARLLTRLRTQLGTAKREYEKSVEDLHRFRINPDDRASGAAFGSFLCFIKGDWQTGLKMIADGGSGDLAEVAKMDLRGASRAIDQVAIADAWWDLSQRGSGIYRQGAEDRAVMWYTLAVERLPESLDKIHVQNRLKEAEETDGRSPIALCLQLADEIGVNLGESLTSIAAQGTRGKSKTGGTENVRG